MYWSIVVAVILSSISFKSFSKTGLQCTNLLQRSYFYKRVYFFGLSMYRGIFQGLGNPYVHRVVITILVAQCFHFSPDGPVRVVDRLGALPKLGVPSLFQFIFCTMVYLLPSQAPLLFEVAW